MRQYEVMANEFVQESNKKITRGVLGDTKLLLYNNDLEIIQHDAQVAKQELKKVVRRRYNRIAEQAVEKMHERILRHKEDSENPANYTYMDS